MLNLWKTILNDCEKHTKLFLQDGDPSQNSAKSLAAVKSVGKEVFNIPPRSPDLNPIENVFNLVGQKLREDAISLNLSKETFHQFQERIVTTLNSIPTETIDKTIESIRTRLLQIISKGGHRTKY